MRFLNPKYKYIFKDSGEELTEPDCQKKFFDIKERYMIPRRMEYGEFELNHYHTHICSVFAKYDVLNFIDKNCNKVKKKKEKTEKGAVRKSKKKINPSQYKFL